MMKMKNAIIVYYSFLKYCQYEKGLMAGIKPEGPWGNSSRIIFICLVFLNVNLRDSLFGYVKTFFHILKKNRLPVALFTYVK